MHRSLEGKGRTVRKRGSIPKECVPNGDHIMRFLWTRLLPCLQQKKKESLDTSQSIYIRARLVCVTDSCACADSEGDLTLDAVMYVCTVQVHIIAGSIMGAAREETS